MKKVINVTSNNQSGGITAGEVNHSNKDIKPKKISLEKCATILGVILAITGILTYFGIKPKEENNMVVHNSAVNNQAEVAAGSQTFNVTSNNQSGGMTVGQLNVISTPQRSLANDESFKNKLLSGVKKTDEITIQYIYSDQEAYQFAEQIKMFLQSSGYHVKNALDTLINPDFPKGVIVNRASPESNVVVITVGANMRS